MAQSIDQLRTEYAKLARRANDRLRALEKTAKQPGFNEILGYAYRNARHDVYIQRGQTDKVRFKTAVPKLESRQQIQRQINAVRSFLDMPSSTKTGIINVYKKRADTLNREMGAGLSWQQYAKFFEGGLWETMKRNYGSKTTFKIIRKINGDRQKIVQQIRDKGRVYLQGVYGRRLSDYINNNKEDFQNYLELTRNGDRTDPN